jgi:hypothetical protein
MTKQRNWSRSVCNLLSRRDMIRAGALLIPATALVPTLFTRVSRAASSSTFAFYISTSGSDSNSGTLASPWAITAINTKQSVYAGARVGILPGTYDVSGLMGTFHSPALMINGGPNASTPTYIGTSSATGQYQVGTATLDAKGASGIYGGGTSNYCTVIGSAQGQSGGPGTPTNWGNWILDGLTVVGFSAWALQVGSYDGAGGQMPNTTIQNCTFANSNTAGTNVTGDHSGPFELYSYTNCTISNCMFSNNTNASSTDNSHFAGITCWGGVGTGASSGLTIQYCTFLNTCGIYGIYDVGVISGTTINNCYFDMSTTGGPGLSNIVAIQGFGNTGAGGLAASSFHHNICKGGWFMDGTSDNDAQDAWATAASYYNNTYDLAGGAAAAGTGFRFAEASGHSGIFTCYNNLCYDNGMTGSLEWGYNASNTDGFALCDYNIYGSKSFTTYGANGGQGTTQGLSLSTWKTAIGNREVHSSANSTNPFTNNGAYALAYQVQAGSPAYQAGRVGGVASGAVCNAGAWDGTVTQIGANLAAGLAVPKAPSLNTVS